MMFCNVIQGSFPSSEDVKMILDCCEEDDTVYADSGREVIPSDLTDTYLVNYDRNVG